MKIKTDQEIFDKQCDFCAGRGTRDQILKPEVNNGEI